MGGMPSPSSSLVAAVQHIEAGRYDQARAALTRVLQQSPSSVDANTWMAYLLMELAEWKQAVFFARRADSLAPGSLPHLNNLGKALLNSGDAAGAVEVYQGAVEIDPGHAASNHGLAVALNTVYRFDEAENICRAWMAKNPGQTRLLAPLSVALLQTGRGREAVRVLREAAAADPGDPVLASGLAQTMNYAGDADPRDVLEGHRAYGRLLEGMHPGPHEGPAIDKDPDRKLRVGFLSADLRAHAVGFFAEPILEHLPRGGDGFDITCYSVSGAEDVTSARLKRLVPTWRTPATLRDPDLAALIRKDRIDVLIELSGHTTGHRLPVLYLRAAPVQATYFGYPNTTGVPGCDYRIVDGFTDPMGPEQDALATEKLVRLDPCFLCYRPLDGAPEVSPPPSLTEGVVTFGSFNNLAKLDDIAVRLYARVMAAVPGSRLILKYIGLASAGVREIVAGRFAKEGIAPERLILDPPGKGAAAMLPAYSRMDVMLDSYPYHGTTTTCEALYMGVPVVTLAGRVCAARVGLSILTTVGFPELVARGEDEYVKIAADLAGDAPRMSAIRAALRAKMLASPVCDGPAFAARFGAALRAMWKERCSR